jgi:MFS transporter, DHA1 family, multidrug resistance protein
MAKSFLIPLCGVMLALNAFSCDILLPSFYAMQADFGAPFAAIQAVVPIYLMAMAAGQILFGPASDRFGRRPVLLVGLGIYIAGSGLGFFANGLETLYAARVLQGLGAACCIVLARAILRDTHSGPDLARAMALAMAILAVGPLCAPLLGVATLTLGGWRAAFVALTVLGFGLLAGLVWVYQETNLALDRQALQPAKLMRAFARVLLQPQSRYFMAVLALLNTTIVLMVASSSRIFKTNFGLEGLEFALLFAGAGSGIIVGQLLNNHWIARHGVLTTTRWAAIALLGSVAVMAVLAWLSLISALGFAALLFVFNLSFLPIVANCVSLILEPHREMAV